MAEVRKIMTENVIVVSQSASIKNAAKLMKSKSVSSLVVAEKNQPIAVINEIDVIRGFVDKKKYVKDILNKEFIVISPSTKLHEVVKDLKEKKIKKFPVVENQKLVGLITETDVIEATRDFTRFQHIVQDVILIVFGLATAVTLFYLSPLGAAIFK